MRALAGTALPRSCRCLPRRRRSRTWSPPACANPGPSGSGCRLAERSGYSRSTRIGASSFCAAEPARTAPSGCPGPRRRAGGPDPSGAGGPPPPAPPPLLARSPAGPVDLARTAPSRAALTPHDPPGSRPVTSGTLDRWRLREALRPFQPYARQRTCGRVALGPVEIGPGWIVGLGQCGSLHVCPACSAARRGERAGEIRALVAAWRAAELGGGAGLLTATVRHSWGTELGELRRRLSLARRADRGRPAGG